MFCHRDVIITYDAKCLSRFVELKSSLFHCITKIEFRATFAAGAGEVVGFNELKLGFDGLTYMQDMTTAKCQAASTYETKQLIDRRDNKKYWITKLQDGNCWMSQNLDLDLTTSGLTTTYTDITSNWTSGVTATQKNSVTSGTFASANEIASYDPGNYVYMTPNVQRNCGSGITATSQCTSYGWKEVTGFEEATNPNYTAIYDNTAVNGTSYDSHYHAGNYYTWTAATAGTGTSISGGSASGSICPKNWKLPLSNTVNNTVSGSFYYLLREYGVESRTPSTATTPQYDIRLSPLFFVYGGYVASSSLNNAGNEGRYWSSTANSDTQAYNLRFNTTVNPSNNNNRYNGNSVRCVACSNLGIIMCV